MRQYKNEIDAKIIETAFSKEELDEFKEIAKIYEDAKTLKYETEAEIKRKIAGYVIGDLEGVNLCYTAYDKSLLIQYKIDSYEKEDTLLNKIKGVFK